MIVKVPYMWFSLHDCPFKGLGSLPEFIDLTPRCKIDFLLHHAVQRFDSPLQHAAASFDSPLHNAAKIWLPAAKYSRNIWLPAASCSEKISATVIDLTPSYIRRDLTPRCIMRRRGLTPRFPAASCSGVSNFYFNNSTNLNANSKKT